MAPQKLMDRVILSPEGEQLREVVVVERFPHEEEIYWRFQLFNSEGALIGMYSSPAFYWNIGGGGVNFSDLHSQQDHTPAWWVRGPENPWKKDEIQDILWNVLTETDPFPGQCNKVTLVSRRKHDGRYHLLFGNLSLFVPSTIMVGSDLGENVLRAGQSWFGVDIPEYQHLGTMYVPQWGVHHHVVKIPEGVLKTPIPAKLLNNVFMSPDDLRILLESDSGLVDNPENPGYPGSTLLDFILGLEVEG